MRRFVLYLCTIALFAIGLSSTANAVPQPFLQARSLGFSNATSSSVQVNWTRGAGQRVILIVKSGAGSFDNAGFTDQPEDGQSEAVPPMTWDVDPPYTNVGDEGDFSNAGSNWDKGGAVVVYEGTGTSVTVTGLTPNTTYTFKVMELNSSTTPAADNPNFAHNVFQQSERQFTTPLGAPTGLFADDIMATQANLNWNAVTGATGYQIQVATDLAMTNVLPGYNVLDVGTNLEWLVTGLTQQTQYHYRVRAYLNSQYTGWSDVATFTTDQDIDPPSVQALIPDAEGSVNSTVVNDGTAAYIGDQFTLTVDYSETMNYFGSANPTLVFNPSVASTLTLLYGYWSDTDKYTAVYSVADADVETAVDVTVNGGEDLAGNSHGTTNFDDNFFIDTKAPIISNLELINPSDDNCVKEGTVVEYRFEVVEEGYGTFNQDDITISENLTLQNPAGQQFVSQTGSGSVANPYVFTY
ncbi:MAG: fibronectin type III domain-containing protein, partial [Bacteroidota bacterium]